MRGYYETEKKAKVIKTDLKPTAATKVIAGLKDALKKTKPAKKKASK
jgi:hypothetical protein